MTVRRVVLLFLLATISVPVAGQGVDLRVDPVSDLNRRIDELEAEVRRLQAQLNEVYDLPQIRQLIAQEERRRQQEELDRQPLDVTLSVTGAPFKGDRNAPITILEFSDYECPACGAFAQRVQPDIFTDFVETGEAKLVFFDYPLQRHTKAFKAAEAAHCAGDQGKYWEMHDQLFENQQQLDEQLLSGHAESIGLDVDAFTVCLETGKFAEKIRARMAEASKVRLRGTPHFAIGYTRSEGDEVQILRSMSGASYQKIQMVIDELTSDEEGPQ
jgi:protein-disulfide isomerase